MNKRSILVILVVFMFSFTNAQDVDDFQSKLYQYYANEEMGKWDVALRQLVNKSTNSNEEELFDMVNAYYGLIGFYIAQEQDDLAEKKLEEAQEKLELLLQMAPNNQQYKAYEAAYISIRMAFSPWKIMSLGSQSKEILDLAIQNHPENPVVCFEYANMKYYAPGLAGGDKDEALKLYKKAYQLFEQQEGRENWYYLLLKTQYGDACAALKKTSTAEQIYREILKQTPKLEGVKTRLNSLD